MPYPLCFDSMRCGRPAGEGGVECAGVSDLPRRRGAVACFIRLSVVALAEIMLLSGVRSSGTALSPQASMLLRRCSRAEREVGPARPAGLLCVTLSCTSARDRSRARTSLTCIRLHCGRLRCAPLFYTAHIACAFLSHTSMRRASADGPGLTASLSITGLSLTGSRAVAHSTDCRS